MGLTPALSPAKAHGGVALAGTSGGGVQKVDLDTLTDYLSKGNGDGLTVRQIPPSPVKVGTRNIRFQVTSPHAGYVILLNLSDDGKLIQLFPNQFSKKNAADRDGAIRANAPLTVPDAYYGLKFNASAPSRGSIVAIVSRDPVKFGANVTSRKIEVIPSAEVTQSYLPKLAAALGTPVNTNSMKQNNSAAKWSVATLPYEIRP